MNTIYAILDDARDVVYVGATSLDTSVRVAVAFSHRLAQHGPLELWLRDYGRLPAHIILERAVPDNIRDLREAFWIAVFTAADTQRKLLNVGAFGGGRKGAPMPQSVRDATRARVRADHAAERALAEEGATYPCDDCVHISPTNRGLGIHRAKVHKS